MGPQLARRLGARCVVSSVRLIDTSLFPTVWLSGCLVAQNDEFIVRWLAPALVSAAAVHEAAGGKAYRCKSTDQVFTIALNYHADRLVEYGLPGSNDSTMYEFNS
jgi:hypothetical protein